MQCPVCSHALSDPFQEACPHCGAAVADGNERAHEEASAETADPRLKELIADVKKSLAGLPGDAEPPVRDHAAEPPHTDDAATEAAFDLDIAASAAEAQPVEGVSEENLAAVLGALDRSLPAESVPARRACRPRAVFFIFLAALAAAGIIYYLTGGSDTSDHRGALVSNQNRDAGVSRPLAHKKIRRQAAARSAVPAASDNHTPESAIAMPAGITAIPATGKPARGDNDTTVPGNAAPAAEQPVTVTTPALPVFSIHTDSYRTLLRAQRESERLQSLGRDAFVQPFDAGTGRWYRVLIGHYPGRAEALGALEEIRCTLGKNDARIVMFSK